jgi:hypothetical protein
MAVSTTITEVQEVPIEVSALSANGRVVPFPGPVIFQSNNTEVATVNPVEGSPTAVIKGVSPGIASVIVTSGNLIETISVTVTLDEVAVALVVTIGTPRPQTE